MTDTTRIRPLSTADSAEQITALLHTAYATLAAQGWNYTAATQSAQTTRERIAHGQCFVAELLQAQGGLPAGALVGSVCISPPKAADTHYVQTQDSAPALYTRADTAILAQLAVHPALRGQGLAERLCDAAEDWARQRGFAQVALDTAESATALRARYQRRGYRDAGHVQWSGKTYASVLMCKELKT
ncbi:GNAT family N-acetyltransferase [Vandammella animalimorsus]|uniref:GNAT family N-acetyltransferase n=1 Tax=Vandammella animalimorsus TaxID=2029117 RepID=UPI0031BA444D